MLRVEYPRPQWVREDWLNLNGEWQFAFDDLNLGIKEKWESKNKNFDLKIQVPFAYQTECSGIHDTSCHDVIWYKRNVRVPSEWKDKKVLLHFGAVDYICDLYVNEIYVGSHEGGHTSFKFDITRFLNWEEENITLRIFDPSHDESIPRGKQTWQEKPHGIWYTRTSGIWQTVWMEPVDYSNIEDIKMTSDLNTMSQIFDVKVSKECIGKILDIEIRFKDKLIAHDYVEILENEFTRSIQLFKAKVYQHGVHGFKHGWMWSPECPNLFDVTFKIVDELDEYDVVDSYFGMRSIRTEKGMVLLNNKPYYQKLVLNQGYWRKGLLTAPNDSDFVKDIEMMKSMGFNGCRIHQKVEDPRFLYWADKLGFIVWGECAAFPSWHVEGAKRLYNEWYEIIQRDYNHPCIVTWTPMNESWGVEDIATNKQQQSFALGLYHYVKSFDPTRLVISNDGWESVETDICGIHNYRHGQENEVSKYKEFELTLSDTEHLLMSITSGHRAYVNGYEHKGQPILLTEFGGIAYDTTQEVGWGYTSVMDEESFIKDYRRIMEAIYASKTLHGYCYTQLSDVEQEINGLLDFDHQPKVDPKKIKEINDMWHSVMVQK